MLPPAQPDRGRPPGRNQRSRCAAVSSSQDKVDYEMSHDEFQTINAIGRNSPFRQRLDIFPSKLLSGVMNENMEAIPAESASLGKARHRLRVVRFGVVVVLLYLLAVYVVTPSLWKRDVRRHPEL